MYQSYPSSADANGPCVSSRPLIDSTQPVWSARMVARYRRDLSVAATSWMLAVDGVPMMSCGPDTSPVPWSTGRTLLLTPKVSQTVTRYPYGYYSPHMDTNTKRDMSDTDPALDALNWLTDAVESAGFAPTDALLNNEEAVRDALADRITADEARIALTWEQHVTARRPEEWQPDAEERTLIARLGRIADLGHDAALTARVIARQDEKAGR
jgi:hypothetical protein